MLVKYALGSEKWQKVMNAVNDADGLDVSSAASKKDAGEQKRKVAAENSKYETGLPSSMANLAIETAVLHKKMGSKS
jgi:hypothetical protein